MAADWLERTLSALRAADSAKEDNALARERVALSIVFGETQPERLKDYPEALRTQVVMALWRLAELNEQDGRVNEALASLNLGIDVWLTAGARLKAAAVRQELIEVQLRQGQDIESACREALGELAALGSLAAGSPAHLQGVFRLQAAAHAAAGKWHGRQGRLEESQEHNLKAVELAVSLGDVALEAKLRPVIGLTYAAWKQARFAVPELSRALEVIAHGDASLKPLLLKQRGEMRMRQADSGHLDPPLVGLRIQATADFLAAAPLFELAGEAREAGHCWYEAARNVFLEHYAVSDEHGLRRAKQLFENAERAHVAAGIDAPYAALVRAELGTVCYQLGELRQSRDWFRSAAWLFDRLGNFRDKTVSLLGAAAMEAQPAGAQVEPRGAPFLTYRRTLDGWREWRLRALTTEQRAFEDENVSFLRHVVERLTREAGSESPWRSVAAQCLWETEQLTKSTDLLDQLALRQLSADPRLRELAARAAEARAALAGLRGPVAETPALRSRYRAQRERLRAAVRMAERALREQERLLEGGSGAKREALRPRVVSVDELRRQLRSGELYVGLLWNGGSPIRLKVSAADGLSVERAVDPPAAPLWEQVRTWVDAARDNGSVPAWRESGTDLLGELPDEVRTVFICPDGELANLPWHALPYKGRRLEERVTVATIPSASTLVHARSRTVVEPEVPYLGVAEYADGAIPLVDEEVRLVRERHFPDSEILESGRSIELLSRRGHVGLLHIACHASREGLLLSGARVVRSQELAVLDLGAEILLLSGCDLGRFDYDETNRFDGIVRELLVATGARSAVVSAARVKDELGLSFSTAVAEALTGSGSGPAATPMPVGAAVAWARTKLRSQVPAATHQKGDPSLSWFVIGDPLAALTPVD
jgi:tetratricopeptide (TPR) repeat protein